jgi:hypothetical protein
MRELDRGRNQPSRPESKHSATRLVPVLFFFQKSTMKPLSAAFMSLSLADELQNRSHEVSWAT